MPLTKRLEVRRSGLNALAVCLRYSGNAISAVQVGFKSNTLIDHGCPASVFIEGGEKLGGACIDDNFSNELRSVS